MFGRSKAFGVLGNTYVVGDFVEEALKEVQETIEEWGEERGEERGGEAKANVDGMFGTKRSGIGVEDWMRGQEIIGTEDEEIIVEKEERVIPTHFALKSYYNHKYLRYINEDEKLHGFLQFSGERVVSPYSKFHVETSKLGKGFIHIRCSYNNKYWARLSSASNYIVAAAHEPEEDPSKWSCTLFEPVYDREENAYAFRHFQHDHQLFLSDSSTYPNCLLAEPEREDIIDWRALFTVVDWDSIFMLPRHVAFKGSNGEYLKVVGSVLQFSGSDIKDPSVAHEIFPTSDGNICIRNEKSGKFWIHDPNWIYAASTDAKGNDPNTLFWPVKVDNNIVALRNLGNNRFCSKLTADGKENYLNANVENIVEDARMEITELVVSRVIENVEYRLKDARIYGQKVLSMVRGDAINKTKETDTITFKFSYENKTKKNWSSSISTKFGVSMTFKGGVPLIGNGELEISAEVGNEYAWGETHKEKKTVEVTRTITVPPMSRVKMNAIVTQGSCDVPFSYTQNDTLKSGKQVIRRLHDGIFSGVNSYDFKFQTQKVPL